VGCDNLGMTDVAQVQFVSTAEELRDLIGTPSARVAGKVRTSLHQIDRQWLAASPFTLLATSDSAGRCDVSPKGDPPGATLVLDDRTIVLADRPGNRRVDGFLNVLTNPHVGLIFLVPGRGDTLRINGQARLVREAPFFDDLVVKGHRPKLAMLVDVEEVFFHCSKAFLRSKLWQPNTWNEAAGNATLPSRAHIAQTLERPEDSIETLEQYYGPSYADKLYTADSSRPM
jgi:PPOX class probable FMN-dependent enzyme